MTDEELIARLRWKAGAYAKEAADRIEQLVATNEVLVKERDQWIEHTKNAVWSDSEELKLANARAALTDATADAATHGIGIMQDGKRIAPQDFFAVRDVDDKS